MPNLKFQHPDGRTITVDSPDGSTPSEQVLDQLFALPSPKPQAVMPEQVTPEQPQESIGQMLLKNLRNAGEQTYKEGIAPILEGASTFAAGIPKMISKAQDKNLGVNATGMVFPEQKTLEGKALRGISEMAGFAAGLPGKAAVATGKVIGKGASMLPKFAGKQIATKIAQGAGAGAAGMVLAGDTLENRKQGAIGGALVGGTIAGIPTVAKTVFNKLGRVGAALSGVEKEVFEEAQKKGFRKVLQSKYYSKNLPSKIQQRIADNIDSMSVEAGNQYDELVKPLKAAPFDMAKLRGEVIKIANRVKTNPFDTESSQLDKAIMDGVINKAKANNLGSALDLRRNLDDVIYSNKGELRSSFGKQVRDLLNKELHKNKDLASVDKEWASFKDLLKEGKKVLGDTGEKILERFGNLTDKQKQRLIGLERKIGGEPFIEDLSNYSIAKDFVTRKITPSLAGVLRATTKPLTRGFLRQGEKVTEGLEKFDKERISKLFGDY